MNITKKHFLLAALGILLLLVLFMGSRGLNEPDEGRYANIGASLLNPSVSWMEPRLSGYIHYDKPPLIYWTTALSFKAFGVNEWAARLPSLLGACMALAGACWAAFRLYGKQTSWWTLIIGGSLAQFWLLARFLTPDMLLTGCCALAIGAWAECRSKQGHWGYWCLSLLFWVLAWWDKSIPALVPFLGLLIGILIKKDKTGLRALRPLRMLLASAILGSPWILLMIWWHPQLTDFFFHRQMVGHMAGGTESRDAPLWYYLALSPIFWLPWSLLLLGLLFRTNRHQATEPESGKEWFGVSGYLVCIGLIILTLNSSKLPTYTLTLTPWVALVFARIFIRYANLRWQRIAQIVTIVFYLGIFIVAKFVYIPHLQPAIGANSSLQPVAEKINQEGGQTVILDRYWPGFEFYFKGNIIYAVPNWIQQRSNDTMVIEPGRSIQFIAKEDYSPDLLNVKNLWFIHYRKADSEIEKTFLNGKSALSSQKIGDFTLKKITP